MKVIKIKVKPKPDMKATLEDVVNHPQHYNKGGIECIDAMISAFGVDMVRDFCLCNVFKYVFRCMHKNGIEDLKKAEWYLKKYAELEGGNDTDRKH